ncbi:type II toxin-antitoxin system RelE/ParE family toxin [Phytomonospora endophytica]|uniref:Type II toxin-antitoxin system RelE/ParE family toxin n=1 Tax=Phytomonospora endophytica TaxID=714109 RepID=A0A841FAF8_9ACTN|nr:type II toxin-antitoxin system RelE/ParE family toxin [Phytomonospora endophytica]MBB6034241.1 hypothetical protein [Phytomonospora endophytica]
MDWGTLELEPEVEAWFLALPPHERGRVIFHFERLVAEGVLLGEPHSKQLAGKLRELRFCLVTGDVRVTYWIATGRRIILLTVFRKQARRETAEVERAIRALEKCQREGHTVDEESVHG